LSKKSAIQEVVKVMMDRVMENVLHKDPFDVDFHKSSKPLYAALVPDEIFKGSHFERRFVTPFGGVWEKLAVVAAKEAGFKAEIGFSIKGLVPKERLNRIQETLNKLEHPEVRGERITPDWKTELKYVLAGKGPNVPVTVQCDVYVEMPKKKLTFEVKAPQPNSDQTKVSKEKIFKLYAMEPPQVTDAYFVLPYNPYGERKDYDWAFPKRWFNMTNDPVVLIGNEFWDEIGGVGTYKDFLTAINEIGPEYKKKIYKEYLGIDVDKLPDKSKDFKL
jgi:hypothetical protein